MKSLYLLLLMVLVLPTVTHGHGVENLRIQGGGLLADNAGIAPKEANCSLTEEEATELVMEAYIYAFPLVLMNATRENFTNVAYPTGEDSTKPKAPINQLSRSLVYADASFTDVVGVNTDTLNNRAYMDLSDEPLVLHVPAMDDSPSGSGKRYYIIPLHDPWTNVYFTIGSRTTGNEAQTYAIVGPHWHGRLPRGVVRIDSPADVTFLIARIYCEGGEDVANVNALQLKLDLRPLSAIGNPDYEPPPGEVDPDIDSDTPPSTKVLMMNSVTFFGTFVRLLQATPPPRADQEMIHKLKRAGIVRGCRRIRDFDVDRLNPVVASVLDAGIAAAKLKVQQVALSAPMVNGWMISNAEPYYTGAYGTNYLLRAFVNIVGYGAVLTADALYPAATTDSSGAGLTNLNNYKVHFEPGQLPPVNENAFWSLTLYNRNRLLVDEINMPDPTDRTCYTVHAVDVQERHFNPDGSLDIYVTTFANKGANVPEGALWLPSPTPGNERFQPPGSQGLPGAPGTAPFTMGLRLFWPDPEAYDGTWAPPVVEAY